MMCGRYFFDPQDWEEARGELCRKYGEKAAWMALGEVFPGQWVVVKANNRKQQPGWFLMQWGLMGFRGKQRLINARIETANQKATFKEAMAHRRCLIPMQGYYEWEQRAESRQKHMIVPVNETKIYLAGLYRHEEKAPALVVLTREAAADIRHIHPRMPVIIAEKDAAQWLAPGPVCLDWLEQAAVQQMRCTPVLP